MPKQKKTSSRSTVSGPSKGSRAAPGDAPTDKFEGTNAVAAAMPSNKNKPLEYGRAALKPQAGAAV